MKFAYENFEDCWKDFKLICDPKHEKEIYEIWWKQGIEHANKKNEAQLSSLKEQVKVLRDCCLYYAGENRDPRVFMFDIMDAVVIKEGKLVEVNDNIKKIAIEAIAKADKLSCCAGTNANETKGEAQ